jgi:nicotinate-nucleotide adenylyltransferase
LAVAWKRFGILGGTLDPVHFGHLRAAEEVREALRLDGIVLIPAASPPHKQQRAITPFHHRYEMARAAVEGIEGYTVSAMEGQRPGPSYSIETIREIKAARPGAAPYFIIGADAFVDFGIWREYDRIPVEAQELVVVSRPGIGQEQVFDAMDRLFPGVRQLDGSGTLFETGQGGRIRYLRVTALDISSTSIRQRRRAGLSVRFLLPEKVIEYMVRNELYLKTKVEHTGQKAVSVADSEEMARAIQGAIRDNKGEKIVVLDMRGVSPVADFFIIAHGRSTKHVQGMASRMKRDLGRSGIKCLSIEGESEGKWILMDFDDVVVHLFYEPVRGFYDLEGLWYEAPRMPWAYDDKAGPEQGASAEQE